MANLLCAKKEKAESFYSAMRTARPKTKRGFEELCEGVSGGGCAGQKDLSGA